MAPDGLAEQAVPIELHAGDIPLPEHARSGSIYEVQSALAESAFG